MLRMGRTEEESMIDVQKVTKRLGKDDVLRNLSFQVLPKRVCGFLGHNGAGKTTTLRMLCGLLAPDEGHIRVAGYCPFTQGSLLARRVGYLPEEPLFYKELRVQEQLHYMGELFGLSGKSLSLRIEELLEACALRSHAKFLCSQLSRGYRQRLGLAQALIHDPEVLLLDEPSSGLDPSQSADFRILIKDLSLRKTVLLSTHNLSEARILCDEVLVLHAGAIALHAATKDIPPYLTLEELFHEHTLGKQELGKQRGRFVQHEDIPQVANLS